MSAAPAPAMPTPATTAAAAAPHGLIRAYDPSPASWDTLAISRIVPPPFLPPPPFTPR